MLDLKFVRNNIDLLKEKLLQRGSDLSLDEFMAVDGERRKIIQDVEDLRNRRNLVSKEVGRLKKEGQKAEHLMEEMKVVNDRIKEMETVLEEKETALSAIILSVPNIPHPGVPIGKDSSDNPVAKRWGDIRQFDFEPRSHWDIGEELDILDFERGAKISGARFTLYKGLGAQLERALINFMLDLHASRHHYTEVWPPFIVNDTSMTATGQLPKFKEDLFKLEGRDYYLIPTAEVPVTNIHRDEVLEEKELPKRYVAYSACFRAEAGSYGKDTRGLIRQHQFNKVELVKFTTPETSYLELENLLLDAEEVLQQLGLPYQVIELCTGDLGFSAAKTYDIEVWLPGQGTFREISSCSNFEDFQSRRGNIRFRRSGKTKTELVHTLNGSGVAVGRTVVAILENYQQADGSVVIPPVLRPYLMGKARIEKSA
ncbi:MAG: serine--tRNA ligase [Deltaproteobacteria bacterium]|nr:serine--tRNA ligase [Deltaproteobacteria bacterium]TSA06822.1 MAG: serine--tRNA ligase [Deltaproteobacteria bacterium]